MKCQIASILSTLLAVSSAQAQEASDYSVAEPTKAPVVQSRSMAAAPRVPKHLSAKRQSDLALNARSGEIR